MEDNQENKTISISHPLKGVFGKLVRNNQERNFCKLSL